ncbi:STAS domain-containing protein [Robbsia sp. KACC 23696]|uniref:STAS domain-containing protein n=1 Tax=Robbsia sp. KACC 23696 TaxID=3149231 RepID=UPI00325BE4F1
MQIDQTEQQGWQVMHLNGRLDGNGAPLLGRAIDAYLDDGGRHLVLDLSRLSYISSIGLRVLLMAGKRLARPSAGAAPEGGVKGQLVLATLKANVREVFEMSGFIALFPVIDDLTALQPASG